MTPILKAIRIVGTQERLAEMLGLTKQAVNQWATGVRGPTPYQCVMIEKITKGKVKRVELRPDIFGPIRDIPLQPVAPRTKAETERAA